MMEFYGASDVGLKRSENQDSYTIIQNDASELLAVVCDGIGGGNAGDVASAMAAQYLKEKFLQTKGFQHDVEVKHWIYQTLQEANDLIFMQSVRKKAHQGMGTTCVGIIKTDKDTYVFNVGDSRVYGLYKEFVCLTEDHSLINDLLKSGEITEKEAITHPNRNVLTNALGIMNQVRIDVNKIKAGYEKILICSDGLHGYIPENFIETILRKNDSAKSIASRLIELSKQAGGYDNVTVIVLQESRGDSRG